MVAPVVAAAAAGTGAAGATAGAAATPAVGIGALSPEAAVLAAPKPADLAAAMGEAPRLASALQPVAPEAAPTPGQKREDRLDNVPDFVPPVPGGPRF